MNVEIITKQDMLAIEKKLDRISSALESFVSNSNANKWLKSSEILKVLKCSPASLINYREKGEIEYKKIGGTYYYKLKSDYHEKN